MLNFIRENANFFYFFLLLSIWPQKSELVHFLMSAAFHESIHTHHPIFFLFLFLFLEIIRLLFVIIHCYYSFGHYCTNHLGWVYKLYKSKWNIFFKFIKEIKKLKKRIIFYSVSITKNASHNGWTPLCHLDHNRWL